MPLKDSAKKKVTWILLTAVAIWTVPERAHAYVDPGLLGSLYQIIYVFIFGALAGWVLRPLKFISMKYQALKTRFSTKKPDSPEA